MVGSAKKRNFGKSFHDLLMKRIYCAIAFSLLLTACGGLSKEAREIVGSYYNMAISDDEPVFELNPDGTCVMRAIRPDVLTISVSGTWDVVNDSLVMHHNLATVKAHGDTSLLGTVAPEFKALVMGHTDHTLLLSRNGIEYEYIRGVSQ